jgi:hypothetical protein
MKEPEVERRESSKDIYFIIFFQGHLSSYRDGSKNSEEDGITKLKQKLSLKIKIPENKIQEKTKSFESEPKVMKIIIILNILGFRYSR